MVRNKGGNNEDIRRAAWDFGQEVVKLFNLQEKWGKGNFADIGKRLGEEGKPIHRGRIQQIYEAQMKRLEMSPTFAGYIKESNRRRQQRLAEARAKKEQEKREQEE